MIRKIVIYFETLFEFEKFINWRLNFLCTHNPKSSFAENKSIREVFKVLDNIIQSTFLLKIENWF